MTSAPQRLLEEAVDPTDEEIVARVRAGELGLYAIVMRRHNQTLYRAARAILRDDSEVEDVLQDTYLSAFRHLGEFQGRARFSTWLVRIAINRALDRRRRRARIVPLDAAAQDHLSTEARPSIARAASESPERQSARREVARLLESAIDALPEGFRAVYVLREVEQMSTEETAASLELAVNTVKTRLHRARAMLRDWLFQHVDGATLDAFRFGAERCDRLVAAVLDQIRRQASDGGTR